MTPKHPFVVFPAIDLLDGQSVRLRKGARESAQVVHPDPLQQLQGYKRAGAQWVHIVNLNAAFGDDQTQHPGARKTLEMIRNLVVATGLKIQLGGGIRSIESLATALSSGVERVVIGTWATTQFNLVMDEVRKQPDRFVIGLDSLNGCVAVHGWTQSSGETTLSFAARLKDAGVKTVLFTEIERDGMLAGAAVEATAQLARESGLQVIASGGVRDLKDIQELAGQAGVSGVITGRALAEGTLNLSEALACARDA